LNWPWHGTAQLAGKHPKFFSWLGAFKNPVQNSYLAVAPHHELIGEIPGMVWCH